ncbi:MAG: hypothetical protein ACI835_003217 [Planctomycetota bacterium]|jgi:hypothetical protein
MSAPKHKRKRILIEPRIQLKFAALFLSLACAAIAVQSIVIVNSLQSVASELPHDGVALTQHIPNILAKTILFTFALLLPLSFALGVRTTFGIVGPLYRFRNYLGDVASGKRTGRCSIRKADDLHDLCSIINEVVDMIPEQSAQETVVATESEAA